MTDNATAILEMSGDEVTPADAIEAVRLAVRLLNKVAEVSDAHEFTEDLSELSAAVTGQVILKTLPHVMDGERMNASMKTYWIEVSEELGPDWIEAFRMVGAFMKRVDSF